jgi:hypothetical protein
MRSLIPAEAQRRIMGACETLLGTGFSELVLRPDCQVDLSPWNVRVVPAANTASPGMHADLRPAPESGRIAGPHWRA